MSNIVDVTARITEEGGLDLSGSKTDRNGITAKLKKHAGKFADLRIFIWGGNITHKQRKYFFGVVLDRYYEFFKESGNEYDKSDVEIWMRDKWIFREQFNPVSNRQIKTNVSLSNSSKGLTKKEFEEIKEAIQRYGAGIGVDIPDPDKDWNL